MSQYKRTSMSVDTLEQELKTYQSLPEDTPLPGRKEAGDNVHKIITEITPSIEKFIAKAEAGEQNPNKRIYGAAMVTKIFSLRDRYQKLHDEFTPLYETLCEQWAQYEEEQKKKINEEQEMKRQKELEEEERQRVQAEKEEKERVEKEEKEKLMSLEKQKADEEKRKADQELRERELQTQKEKKVKEEEEAKLKKEKEEEELKLKKLAEEEEEKAKLLSKESNGVTINVKTTHGVTHTLKNIVLTKTVADMKQAIEDNFGVAKAAQRLIFQGRLLVDANPINQYKISDGSAIHMVENARAAAASSSAGSSSSSSSAAAAAAAPPPKPKLSVPPGILCHLANGKDEYDQILMECAKNHRLVVTDWFAPWCGPCRMIAPTFERLCQRFSDVTFIKVDTEASPANAQLAQEHQISAYPTFHYIVNNQVKHSFSGANASNIESNIIKYRAVAISSAPRAMPGGSSSAQQNVPTTLGPIGKQVMSSLVTLQRNLSMTDFIIAVRTLLKFVKNIVENPGVEKYRKVRTANATFQSRIGSKRGGMECMKSFGFEDVTENGDNYIVISATRAADPELRTVMLQLESAVQQASSAPGASSAGAGNPTPTPAPAAATPPLGNMPDPSALAGMFGGAGADGMAELMADPSFHQMAREIMQDPDAMSVIMQAQQAFASGDTATVQRLQSHPAMLRMHQAMTSNPAFLSMMMRQMAERGFPGMGGGGGGGAGAGAGGFPGMGGAGGFPGMGAFGAAPNNNANQTAQGVPPQQPQQQTQAYPGAPTSAEEEERLLQEALRLSMQETQQQDEKAKGNEDKNNEGDGPADKST